MSNRGAILIALRRFHEKLIARPLRASSDNLIQYSR